MAGENPQTTMPPVPREPLIGSNGRMSSQWERWIQQIQRVLSFAGGIAWQIINKAGARLSDLPERTHAMLQDILGTGDRHITESENAEITALDALSAGIVVKVGNATYTVRSIQGTANEIVLSFGDGQSDNPTVSLPLRIAGPRRFGNETDYSEFETDGSLTFNGAATVWDDLATTMSAARVSGASLTATSVGFYDYRFNTGNSVEFPAQELSHGYAEGTQIEFHIHFIVDDATPDTTDRYVKWQIDYWYVPRGSRTAPFPVYTATQTVSTEIKIPANTPAMSEITDSLGTFTNINMKQAGRIKMKVTRIAATGTAPSNSPFLSQVGIHIERARVGSRTMTAA